MLLSNDRKITSSINQANITIYLGRNIICFEVIKSYQKEQIPWFNPACMK